MRELLSFRRHRYLLTAIIIGLVSGPANGAIFMKIPTIPGESQDVHHPEWIVVLGAGGNFSAASCGEFYVLKEIDKAFPQLVASVVRGNVFEKITLEYTTPFDSGERIVSAFELVEATLVNISTQLSASDSDTPIEQLAIQASSIEIKYMQYDSSGNLDGTFTETVICSRGRGK